MKYNWGIWAKNSFFQRVNIYLYNNRYLDTHTGYIKNDISKFIYFLQLVLFA